jgi:ABC-type cobalamin/Fe3+-siderophores transport system ATPase subunit
MLNKGKIFFDGRTVDALTPERIKSVFDVDVEIEYNSERNRLGIFLQA